MPSSRAMSRRRAEVGLLSAEKYSSSLMSCSGVTRERLRRCLTSGAREPQEMARRRRGFWDGSGLSEALGVDAPSDCVGESAEERGEDAQDSEVSWTAAREMGGRSRGVRASFGLDEAVWSLARKETR